MQALLVESPEGGYGYAKGNFDVPIIQSSKNLVGYQVRLRFRVIQHEKDLNLMLLIVKYLGAGKIHKYPNKPAVRIEVSNFKDLTNIIIPFFEKNSIQGIKLELGEALYLDWCQIKFLMNEVYIIQWQV